MATAIAILATLVALIGILLQLLLIFEGLAAVGGILLKKRIGWLRLWGTWHLGMVALLFTFAHESIAHERETFQTVVFQLEGLRILAVYLVLPLVASFLLSRMHLYLRPRCD